MKRAKALYKNIENEPILVVGADDPSMPHLISKRRQIFSRRTNLQNRPMCSSIILFARERSTEARLCRAANKKDLRFLEKPDAAHRDELFKTNEAMLQSNPRLGSPMFYLLSSSSANTLVEFVHQCQGEPASCGKFIEWLHSDSAVEKSTALYGMRLPSGFELTGHEVDIEAQEHEQSVRGLPRCAVAGQTAPSKAQHCYQSLRSREYMETPAMDSLERRWV